MPQITLLNQETIDKIAAGEVVERPASVVKELVENAIDAKATAVTVEIKEGGTSFIRITDNGCGIDRAQVPLAFLRHSTSKIKSVEDLLCVRSLGFRGEALSSIAAVSQVELITKTGRELTGTRYVIEGSKELANEEIGAPDGTTFIVRNLFYNTPARKKFLKSTVTEGNYISDLMERLALSHPDVSFKFISSGQTKMHTSGNSEEKDIIYHIYGRDITAAILPVSAQTALFSVKGFIGKPVISRGNRNFESYFVNGRYIKSALLSKAVEEAYKGFLMQHQYPFCVLYFTVDTEKLDVNVHPTKMELRFSGGEEIYRSLCQTVRDALSGRELIPEVPIEEKKETKKAASASVPEPFETRRMEALRSRVAADSPYERKYPQREQTPQTAGQAPQTPDAKREKEPQTPEINQKKEPQTPEINQKREPQTPEKKASTPENLAVFEKLLRKTSENPGGCRPGRASAQEIGASRTDTLRETGNYQPKPAAHPREEMPRPVYEQQTLSEHAAGFLTEDAAKRHRIIGQLFETYWLVEYGDKLFLIDQHAAHEKVLYERTMARVREKRFVSQNISPPVILTLNAQEQEALGRFGEQIAAFGYEIEPFGGKEFAVNAVPADFEAVDVKSMLLELLDDFSDIGGRDAPEAILEKVASMSCKAAVKGNMHLGQPEAEALIGELLSLENPYHCPHGRPTVISMTKYEIEKKFKRII